MAAINLPFAAGATRRIPSAAELSSGFPCGPADRELFQWLNWWLTAQASGAIQKSGLVVDDTDVNRLAEAIRSQGLNYRTAGGTANALAITIDPAPASYAALVGVPLRVKIGASANAPGAVTLNVNGLGAVPIVRSVEMRPLLVRDLVPGMLAVFVYDGTNFQLQNVPSALGPLKQVHIPASTSYSIVPSDRGTLFYIAGTGNNTTTYTLPLPAAFGAGYVGFLLNYPGTITINVASGADAGAFQFPNDPFRTTVSLTKPKSWLTLWCDGTNWIIHSADPGIDESIGQSLGTIGYSRRAGGLIQQWGSQVVTLNASGDGTVTFPLAYPTAAYNIVAWNGDVATHGDRVFSRGGHTLSAFTFGVRPNPGAVSVRIDWVSQGR